MVEVVVIVVDRDQNSPYMHGHESASHDGDKRGVLSRVKYRGRI